MEQNIAAHMDLAHLGLAADIDAIFFPELSLTGYEPSLAEELACDPGDSRLDIFQALCDGHGITIGVGMPLRIEGKVHIGMPVFQPGLERQVYTKKHLHPDELRFFAGGTSHLEFLDLEERIAPAICYEISVPEHAERLPELGAGVYLASVSKSGDGTARALERLSHVARTFSIWVCMANATGPADDFVAAGRSSAWNRKGDLLGQLDGTGQGVLVLDTQTGGTIALNL